MGQWQDLWLMPALALWKHFHKILFENALPKKQINKGRTRHETGKYCGEWRSLRAGLGPA